VDFSPRIIRLLKTTNYFKKTCADIYTWRHSKEQLFPSLILHEINKSGEIDCVGYKQSGICPITKDSFIYQSITKQVLWILSLKFDNTSAASCNRVAAGRMRGRANDRLVAPGLRVVRGLTLSRFQLSTELSGDFPLVQTVVYTRQNLKYVFPPPHIRTVLMTFSYDKFTLDTTLDQLGKSCIYFSNVFCANNRKK